MLFIFLNTQQFRWWHQWGQKPRYKLSQLIIKCYLHGFFGWIWCCFELRSMTSLALVSALKIPVFKMVQQKEKKSTHFSIPVELTKNPLIFVFLFSFSRFFFQYFHWHKSNTYFTITETRENDNNSWLSAFVCFRWSANIFRLIRD